MGRDGLVITHPPLPRSNSKSNVTFLPKVAVLSKGGLLRIFDPSSSPSSPEILFSYTLQVPAETNTVALGTDSEHATLYAATAEGVVLFLDLTSGHERIVQVPGPISTFGASPDLTAVATGGTGKDVEIYTCAAKGEWASAWKARNVKLTHLKLEVPVHPSQIHFLPAQQGTWRMVVATNYGHVRVYDTAVSRRPVFTAEPSKSAIKAMRIHPDSEIPDPALPLVATKGLEAEKACLAADLMVVYANTSATFSTYSLRERREMGLFKGLDGTVNGISVDTDNGLVAGVGFGRYLAVYDASTRELKSRVFVKTAGCCVVVLDGEDEAVEEPEKRDEEEDVWEAMEEVKTARQLEAEAAEEEGDRVINVRVKRKKDGVRQEAGKKPKISEDQ